MKNHPETPGFHKQAASYRPSIKSIFFFLLLLFYLSLSYSQQPTEEWVRRFSDTSNSFHRGYSIKADINGQIYVLSETNNDFGFIKYDLNGNLLTVSTHWPGIFQAGGGRYFDVSPNGDVYITGFVSTNFDSWIYTVKYNTAGILQWGKLYNPDDGDVSNDIRIDKAGNVIIVGSSRIGSNTSALIIKYTPGGDTLWTRHFNNGQTEAGANKFVIDDTNNIYITGGVGPPTRCVILKYGSSGNLIWSKNFTADSLRSNSGKGIILDNTGNVYVVGTQVTPPFSNIKDYLLRLSNTGDILWYRLSSLLSNGGYTAGPVISLDGNSIYYITEAYNGTGGGGFSIATLKYNSAGDSQWVKMYSGGIPATLNSIGNVKLDRYGNIYVCGAGYYQTTGSDYTIIKYLPTSTQQWVSTYSGVVTNGGDYPSDLYVDTNLNVYVTGGSASTNNPGVTATIRYSQPVGLISGNNQLPQSNKLNQNYPNPFNSSTIITYELPVKSAVQLDIYDLLGRSVKILVNSVQEAGYYSVILNAEEFASGIYFYSLLIENKVLETKKFILIK